jgi:hypothetical protein
MRDENEDPVVIDAVKVGARTLRGFAPWRRRLGAVVYSVTCEAPERRGEPRRRLRLQSGKILDGEGRFVTDFLFVNRASNGVRITLSRSHRLPRKIWLYEDLSEACRGADVVWQKGAVVGCRLRTGEAPFDSRVLRRYREKYYGIG